MVKNKELVFLIKVMSGGGAERVISVLSKALIEKGYSATLIITHQSLQEAKLNDLDTRVRVISLEDELKRDKNNHILAKIHMYKGRMFGKISRIFLKRESKYGLIQKYYARNYSKVNWLKKYFKKNCKSIAIAFLYDSIFLSLLAKSPQNKLIISERGDPEQSLESKTTMAFLDTMFKRADEIVFQSPNVSEWYKEKMAIDGKVIFNPIKSDLPSAFEGERKKKIVNFCRISVEKNLDLLITAFSRVHNDYPEYKLYIYGDAIGNIAEIYLEKIRNLIDEFSLNSAVNILPSRADIHDVIRDYAMFVSSSNFEGMSNSMLEAMAMGMPVVCTDCPAGGARAVIENNKNGLLVPVNDIDAMYLAMKQIVEDKNLSESLSINARKIREIQSVENIIKQWMEIING